MYICGLNDSSLHMVVENSLNWANGALNRVWQGGILSPVHVHRGSPYYIILYHCFWILIFTSGTSFTWSSIRGLIWILSLLHKQASNFCLKYNWKGAICRCSVLLCVYWSWLPEKVTVCVEYIGLHIILTYCRRTYVLYNVHLHCRYIKCPSILCA